MFVFKKRIIILNLDKTSSVVNMAEFVLAERYLTMLPIRVPVLLIGLLPEN